MFCFVAAARSFVRRLALVARPAEAPQAAACCASARRARVAGASAQARKRARSAAARFHCRQRRRPVDLICLDHSGRRRRRNKNWPNISTTRRLVTSVAFGDRGPKRGAQHEQADATERDANEQQQQAGAKCPRSRFGSRFRVRRSNLPSAVCDRSLPDAGRCYGGGGDGCSRIAHR